MTARGSGGERVELLGEQQLGGLGARRPARGNSANPPKRWAWFERGPVASLVGELAALCGLTTSTVLGKAQETPLSPAVRGKLEALKRAPPPAR